jgi:hypothetical protein
VKPEDAAAVRAIADQSGAICAAIGETGGSKLGFALSGHPLFETDVTMLEDAWRNALPSHLDRPAEMAAD